jgi:hypothetical protein
MSPFPASISANLSKLEERVLVNIMWGLNQPAIDKLDRKEFAAASASLFKKLGCQSVDEIRSVVAQRTRAEVLEATERYENARRRRLQLEGSKGVASLLRA